MDSMHPLAAADITAHGDGLRAIARALVRDEHTADDIVQDAYVAALQDGPPRRDLAAWLRGTTRKLSFRFVRGAARRRDRERTRARDTAETVGPSAVLRDVSAAVHGLREPFRTVIVLRYWHGRTPRAIGRQLGTSQNTVRSRLQTGKAELRRQLDRRHGNRCTWITPLGLLPDGGRATVATAVSRDWSVVSARTDREGRFRLFKSKGADEADHLTLVLASVCAGSPRRPAP